MTKAQVNIFDVLRNRHFLALWLGQVISNIGDYFYFLAVPITVNRLTGSTVAMALSMMSIFVPQLLFGLVAGVFVDRWNRKRTMIVADLLRGLIVPLCLTVRSPDQIWVFYLVGFMVSTVSRFFFPARSAAIPLIVGQDELVVANGLSQITQTVALIAGSALAGFAIGLWGEQVAFVADALSYFFSAVFILTITVPHGLPAGAKGQSGGGQLRAVWQELVAGLSFIKASRVLVGVLMSLGVIQLGVGAMQVIWVPFFQKYFGVGPEGLGIVDSLQGFGMAVGAMAVGYLAARFKKTTIIGSGVAVIGILIALIGLSPLFLLVLGLSFVLGLFLSPVQASLSTVIQLAVPDDKMGRVNSAVGTASSLAMLISMAVAGMVGDLVSLRLIYVVSGLIVAVGGVASFFLIPEVKTRQRQDVSQPATALAGGGE
ncbi:MAG: MFS transporter [Anaerolineae bacterium]|nr:MAG: MFS transporter [Anaerolineae bacterium]